MKFIHDWKINKLKIYLYPSSFVVQVLIFKLECHLIMMDNVTIRENTIIDQNQF